MKNTDNFFLPYLIKQTFLSAHLSTIDSKSFQFQSFFTLKHSTYNKKCILNFIFKTIIKYFPTYIFFSLSCFLSFLQLVWIHNFYPKKMKNTDKLNCSPYLLIPIIFYPFWICLLNLIFLFAFFILSSAIIHIKFTQLLFVFCFIHFILIKNIIIDLLIFKEKKSNKSSTKASRLFTFGFFFFFILFWFGFDIFKSILLLEEWFSSIIEVNFLFTYYHPS